MTDAEINKLCEDMEKRHTAEMKQCEAVAGAYNILSDPAITESSELPIAVKALIALALANQPKRDLQPVRKGKPYRECECFWYQVCPKCHWAKHITGCDCPKEQAK